MSFQVMNQVFSLKGYVLIVVLYFSLSAFSALVL